MEEANLPLFTKFCSQMEKEFRKQVDMWVTFNEPAVVCLTGHVFGIFPPGSPSNNTACGMLPCAWSLFRLDRGAACLGECESGL